MKVVKVSGSHSFGSSVQQITHTVSNYISQIMCWSEARSVVDKLTMQVNDLLEPNVRIRELKKDRVNFILENVDIS